MTSQRCFPIITGFPLLFFLFSESPYFSHSNKSCALSQHSVNDREPEEREARELVKCTE